MQTTKPPAAQESSKPIAWVKFSGSPTELLVKYHSMPTPDAQRYFLFRVLEEMDAAKFQAFAAEFCALPDRDETSTKTLAVVLKYWTRKDSAAALAWARGVRGVRRIPVVSHVIAEMAANSTLLFGALARLASASGVFFELAFFVAPDLRGVVGCVLRALF